MTNYDIVIKPDETLQDIIAEINDDFGVSIDEPFAFSAIMTPDKEDQGYHLRVNSLVPATENPYSPIQLIKSLLSKKEPPSKVRYVQPPIELWLTLFRPLLLKMVNKAYPRYELLLRDKDELLSILYLTVLKLHRQGYYLHQTIIQKSFINDLNLECRKLKNFGIIDSLDAPVDDNDEDKTITRLDQIADPDSAAWAYSCYHYTEDDYWEDTFQLLKKRMLEDMSELQFNRILIQLKTKTIDRSTAYKLDKYRQEFGVDYIPRPNSKGKTKGGKK